MELVDTKLKTKYLVLKWNDINNLSIEDRNTLYFILSKIEKQRNKPLGSYVCINLNDEELARKVVPLVEEKYAL